MNSSISKIIKNGSDEEIKGLFLFNRSHTEDEVILKFNLWGRYNFPKYYKVDDAPFHSEIDRANYKIYRGLAKELINSAYRKSAKTTRTKLFVAFCIANDEDVSRKYLKVSAFDQTNSTQFVTDVYNMLITIAYMYPEIFAKTAQKREETMGSFTTSTGVKVLATTVGKAQRGAIQEDARPDWQIFDDFETRKTLNSAVTTKAIWDNMEEARNGGAISGEGCVYLCNYISELGNVHRLVERADSKHSIVINIPIIENGVISWPAAHSQEDIDFLRNTSDDYEGEYLNKPSASKDIYFSREELDAMKTKEPIKEVGAFKMFYEYKSGHRYGSGHDVAGGVGLDSSTSVFIDFDTIPARVVATYASNTIEPEAFGDEIYAQQNKYGGCISGIENNKFDQAVLKAKLLGANLFKSGGKEIRIGEKTKTQYGWNTNSLTKSKMLSALRTAVEDGLLDLVDPELIKEAKGYSRNELIDRDPDARMTTRHFDLLIACAIAWQMKDHSRPERRARVLTGTTPKKKNVAI